MQTAIIGIGRWGKRILGCLPKHFKVSVQADSRTSLSTMWRDGNIEAVIIATPVKTHYDIARKALEAGKHVFCEKPLALKTTEAKELRDLAESKRVVLVTDYIMTFSPQLRKLAAVEHNHAEYFYSLRWRLDSRQELNVVNALLCHDLAILDMFHPLDDLVFSGIDCNQRDIAIIGASRHTPFRCLLTASLDIPQKETMLTVRTSDNTYRYPNKEIPETDLLSRALDYFHSCIIGEAVSNIDRSVRVTDALEHIGEKK